MRFIAPVLQQKETFGICLIAKVGLNLLQTLSRSYNWATRSEHLSGGVLSAVLENYADAGRAF